MIFIASYDLAVYDYRCAVTDSNGTWYSKAVSIDYIKPSLSISANTTSGTSGTVVTMTASAANYSSDASFEWKFSKDGSNWNVQSTSKTSISLYLNSSTAGYWRLDVTDIGWTWTSNTLELQLIETPTVTVVNETGGQAHSGDSVRLTASVQNMTGSVTYQWQQKKGTGSWSNMTQSGYASSVMTFTANENVLAAGSNSFRCVVTDSKGTWTSNEVGLDYLPPDIYLYAGDLVISSGQTKTYSVASGASVTMRADGDFIAGNAAYLWQYSANGGSSWNNLSSSWNGYNTNTLRFTASTAYNGYRFRCRIMIANYPYLSGVACLNVSAPQPKYRALLIGNCDYPGTGSDLPDHEWNVQAMRSLLGSTLTTQYQVTSRLNCSASAILNAIPTAFSGATNNDVSLFYYGGHGLIITSDGTSTGVPDYYHARTGSLCGVDDNYVTPAELRDALNNIPGKIIVILDCCHSGAVIATKDSGEPVYADPAQFTNAIVSAFSGYTIPVSTTDGDGKYGEMRTEKFIVLTACTIQEESWNWWYDGSYAYMSFGTFTKALFEGLGCSWPYANLGSTIPCDTNGDGIASLGECRTYVAGRATQINREMGGSNVQTAQSWGSSTYELFKLR